MTTSWVDHPHFITPGVLFGAHSGTGAVFTPSVSNLQLAASKANRAIYHTPLIAPNVRVPASWPIVTQIMNGSVFGYAVTPVICILGALDFGQAKDPDWPAAGLVGFTNGSMDSILDGWCTFLNTLPPMPILIRIWREMNSTIAPWGKGGATANGSVNETSGETGTYIPALRYVTQYIRQRCRWARFGWCPVLSGGSHLSDYSQWYPGDAYVDWNMPDGYINRSAYRSLQTIYTEFLGGYNRIDGTVSRKPVLVAETGVDILTSDRAARFADYTTQFGSGGVFAGKIQALSMWDTAAAGQYSLEDTPAGTLAAYRLMANTPPFNATPDAARYRILQNPAKRLLVVHG